MGTTFRRVAGADGDRLLVRSRYTYNPGLDVGEATLRRAGAVHDAKPAHRFPASPALRMHTAGAARWRDPERRPRLRRGRARLLAACGCNGLGASNATASGLAAAETLLGVESDLTRDLPRLRQPRSVAAATVTLIGAKATLAFREWKAGIE